MSRWYPVCKSIKLRMDILKILYVKRNRNVIKQEAKSITNKIK